MVVKMNSSTRSASWILLDGKFRDVNSVAIPFIWIGDQALVERCRNRSIDALQGIFLRGNMAHWHKAGIDEGEKISYASLSSDNGQSGFCERQTTYTWVELPTIKLTQSRSMGNGQQSINGAADLGYEEEIFYGSGFQWSPDGSKLHSALHESEVPDSNAALGVALSKDLQIQYQKLEKEFRCEAFM